MLYVTTSSGDASEEAFRLVQGNDAFFLAGIFTNHEIVLFFYDHTTRDVARDTR